MNNDNKTALVLEGGGLRGVFTCGVLDCFMDHGIRFPFTVGVSAGACNGLSYMSGQRVVRALEAEGRIIVIRPERPVEVGRMEKDTGKLSALYQEGYEIASKMIRDSVITR